jgi:hypothetical protein
MGEKLDPRSRSAGADVPSDALREILASQRRRSRTSQRRSSVTPAGQAARRAHPLDAHIFAARAMHPVTLWRNP